MLKFNILKNVENNTTDNFLFNSISINLRNKIINFVVLKLKYINYSHYFDLNSYFQKSISVLHIKMFKNVSN